MRRASTCVAVLGLAVLGLTGTASAAPTVTLKAEAIPIKGFPHTGNIYGAGAAVKAVINISGKEYGGVPPPPIGGHFYLPKFTKLHTTGFPPRAVSNPEQTRAGPRPRPPGSKTGAPGPAH